MFRRRDVSELLEATNEKEENTATRSEPEAESMAEAVPVARAPQRKMTLAEHFAEQASKPVAAGGPRKPLEKPRMPATVSSNAPVTARIQEEEVEDRSKRLLTVGPETCLKGEISHCDRVMIEGQVDAEMSDVELLEIAEGGVFRGTAKVGNAEISGKFDGELSVSGRLVIYERGLVNGKVTYGEIQVMRGGKIVGEIRCPEIKDSEIKEKKSA